MVSGIRRGFSGGMARVVGCVGRLGGGMVVVRTDGFRVPGTNVILLTPFFPHLFVVTRCLSSSHERFGGRRLRGRTVFLLRCLMRNRRGR